MTKTYLHGDCMYLPNPHHLEQDVTQGQFFLAEYSWFKYNFSSSCLIEVKAPSLIS